MNLPSPRLSLSLLFLAALGCNERGAEHEKKNTGASTNDAKNSADGMPKVAPPANMPVAAAKKHVQRVPTSFARVEAKGQLGPGLGTIIIDLVPGKGNKLTEGAPLRVQGSGKDLTFPNRINRELKLDELPIRLPIDVADGATGPAEIDLTYYYCEGGDTGSCRPERAHIDLELDLSGGSAGGEAHFSHSPGK